MNVWIRARRYFFLWYTMMLTMACTYFPAIFHSEPLLYPWSLVVDIAAIMNAAYTTRLLDEYDQGRFADKTMASVRQQLVFLAANAIVYSLLHLLGAAALVLVLGEAWRWTGPVTLFASLATIYVGIHFDDVYCRVTDVIRGHLLDARSLM